jgi:hypothetical protein
MKKIAWACAQQLLDVGRRKRKWTPEESREWTRAFNALKRLAGKS